MGKMRYENVWEMTATPENNPDDTGTEVGEDGLSCAIITDLDSITFLVKQGGKYPFRIILNEKDTVWGRFIGRYPKAHFTEGYKKENDGKTLIEIPKFYELVNILMAITPTGVKDSGMINHDIDYFNQVQAYFKPFKSHKAVALMDSLLKKGMYFDIKMDAYAYDFNKQEIVEKKQAYNRIGWSNKNTITDYVSVFEDFAKTANFSVFYTKNKPFYLGLVRAYQDSLGVPEMQKWLNLNFPTMRYNCFKIIFSPLVDADQSTTEFDNDDFKEGQPHVNFPFYWHSKKSKISEKAVNIKRGNIVFTELNHLFENAEFDKGENGRLFGSIPFNLSLWADKNKAAGSYGNPRSCVEEYMNWALVSLRYVDFAPKKDLEILLTGNDDYMNRRGFTKFKAFNRFLVDAYTKRQKGQVVADLYPSIINWFKENNK